MVNNQHDFQKIRQQLLKESKLKNKYIIVQDNIKFINDLYNHDMLSTYKLSQIVNIILQVARQF
jgi:GGDEF domain-containing protein